MLTSSSTVSDTFLVQLGPGLFAHDSPPYVAVCVCEFAVLLWLTLQELRQECCQDIKVQGELAPHVVILVLSCLHGLPVLIESGGVSDG